ncbi:MAG: ABC transporter ATP-binding protein [bacterium]|nr:ABC transporter ATP-binding protein [bacterium]
MKIIEFVEIERAFKRGVNVLDGVSFDVEQGEVVGLLGCNGAGKTTLISIAMGMLQQQRGEVRLFGLDPIENPLEVKRRVGYVSEDQILPDFLRVREVLHLHRHLFPTWDDDLTADLVTRFDIDLKAKIKTLSKGQARQVALLCAVAHRPEVLLLDEPAGGLDPAVRREFLETAIQLLNESGSTILFSSHHMSDVERMARRVVMLHEGNVLLDNELDDLREQFSLALIPDDGQLDSDALRALPGCLAVRQRNGNLHAILRHGPEDGRALLTGKLGVSVVRCESIPLEEMFIELVGGQA